MNLSFKAYENIAIRSIQYYCKVNGLSSKRFINDPDYIDAAIDGLIQADIKFNPVFGVKLKTFRYKGVVLSLLSAKKMKDKRTDIFTPEVQEELKHKISDKNPIDDLINHQFLNNIIEKSELSDEHKEILSLKYVENKTFAEIGQLKGYSKQNAQQTIEKIIVQLRNCVVKHGIQE